MARIGIGRGVFSGGRARAVLGLLVWVWGVGAAGWAGDADPAQGDGTTLRVMTFNIHHGVGLDGQLDIDRIAELIADAEADVVGLQEVDRGTQRVDERDLLNELGERLDMHTAFGKNLDHQGGGYGNAVLSRFPIVEVENHSLTPVGSDEPRGILQCRLKMDGELLHVLTTHFDHQATDSELAVNIGELESVLQGLNGPWVLLGDFNVEPDSKTYQRLTELAVDAWTESGSGKGATLPSDGPTRRIDYIFLKRGNELGAVETRVLETQASDHQPVVTEIRWQ